MAREKTSFHVDFGERLKAKRKYLGLTQDEFANRLGVTRDTLSRYERGEVAPSFEVLLAINAVDPDVLSIDGLLFGVQEREEKPIPTIRNLGTMIGMKFGGSGKAEILLTWNDLRVIFEVARELEQMKEDSDKKFIDDLSSIISFFFENDGSRFASNIIIEPVMSINGVRFTPSFPHEEESPTSKERVSRISFIKPPKTL